MSIASSIEATHLVRDTCLCLRAQRAARFLSRRFDKALKPSGLTSGQFSLLNAVNREAPPSMADVATLLGADRTTLTAALKPLTRRGLVDTRIDPADRRGRRLVLTAEGHALLAQVIPLWRRCHGELEAELGERTPQLRAGLDALAG
jgi:DNA-binding MarR family transcriptional regulator